MSARVAGTPASRTPPRRLMRWVVNPVVRVVARSPAGRWTGGLLVLQLTGRRTGRALAVPVMGHVRDGELYAITDGRWAANFRNGAPVTVLRRGRSARFDGTLLEDPAAARIIRAVVEEEGQRAVGLVLPPETADADLARLRHVIRLTEV